MGVLPGGSVPRHQLLHLVCVCVCGGGNGAAEEPRSLLGQWAGLGVGEALHMPGVPGEAAGHPLWAGAGEEHSLT